MLFNIQFFHHPPSLFSLFIRFFQFQLRILVLACSHSTLVYNSVQFFSFGSLIEMSPMIMGTHLFPNVSYFESNWRQFWCKIFMALVALKICARVALVALRTYHLLDHLSCNDCCPIPRCPSICICMGICICICIF